MDITVSGNTIARVGDAGIDVSTLFGDHAKLFVKVLGNNVSLTGGPGIAVGNMGNLSTMEATIAGNTIFDASSFAMFPELGGIHMELWSDTTTTNTFIVGNKVQNVFGPGVQVIAMENSEGTFVIGGNTIAQTAKAGVNLLAMLDANLTVTNLSSNAISQAGGDGMKFVTGDATATLDIADFNNNRITNSTDNSIYLDAFPGSTLKINGATNNVLGTKGLFSLDSLGSPTGDVILNFGPVTLPSTVP